MKKEHSKIKVGIQSDTTIALNVAKCVQLLNSICQIVQFSELPQCPIDIHSTRFVNYEQESSRLMQLRHSQQMDFIAYVTGRPYEDNYYSYSSSTDLVLSIVHWEHYTSLPPENGVLYFIANCLANLIYSDLQHEDATGCLYDFLWDKTGIDRCMKMGFICPACHKVLESAISKAPDQKPLYTDMIRILDVIANTSRWGKSVLGALQNKELSELSPAGFEDLVADYYRSLGAKVNQNVNIAGFQIDVFVSENTPSGEPLRSVVECKFYQDKVGNRIVNDFARIVETIKDAGEADKGIIVAYSGFTQDAHLSAKHSHVRLIHYKDIAAGAKKLPIDSGRVQPVQLSSKTTMPPSKSESESWSIFVIMPFSSDLDDLFYYGIHGAIKQMRATCTRIDQVHFTGDILQEIYQNIRKARLIVAEVSQQNSNVFYELGFAHALGKPVILLAKDVSKTPFDISGFNHIVYKNITDLEQKLTARLKAIIGCPSQHQT